MQWSLHYQLYPIHYTAKQGMKRAPSTNLVTVTNNQRAYSHTETEIQTVDIQLQCQLYSTCITNKLVW